MSAVALSSWTSEGWFHQAGSPTEWNWRVFSNDNRTVVQQRNAFPSVYCSNFQVSGTAVQGAVRVNTEQDNDFIGFVYGYHPGDFNNTNADFLLFDWKQSNQTYSFECGTTTAMPGLAVSRVRGIPVVEEFWGHEDLDCDLFGAGGVEELQRGTTLGSTGWEDSNEYVFRFEFGEGSAQEEPQETETTTDDNDSDEDEDSDERDSKEDSDEEFDVSSTLRLYIDDSLEIELPAEDYVSDGAFCFYTFSQSGVRFRGVSVEDLTPMTALAAERDRFGMGMMAAMRNMGPMTLTGRGGVMAMGGGGMAMASTESVEGGVMGGMGMATTLTGSIEGGAMGGAMAKMAMTGMRNKDDNQVRRRVRGLEDSQGRRRRRVRG